MTTDFTNDEQLGELLRGEVPTPGADYWTNISATLGTSIHPDAVIGAGQPIDVAPGAATAVPFRTHLRRGFGGTAALVAAAALLIIVGVLVGTRVQRSNERVDAGFAQDPSLVVTDPDQLEALPGPRHNRDHWHAVYGVWDCTANDGQGDWLPKFDSWDDQTGIHSHDDGMIYIHPFFAESAGRNATFSHFANEMRFELTDTSITLEDGYAMVEGTLCNDRPAVVHMRRWQLDLTARTESVSSARIITENLNGERFYNDREVWILALAPLDAEIPLPPPERFDALDDWSLPGNFEAPPVIDERTMRALDGDIARTLEPPPEPVTRLPSNEPTTVFSELIKDPRPAWTGSIIDDTFRPIAVGLQASAAQAVLASWRISTDDDTSAACVGIIGITARDLVGPSYCHPNATTPPSAFFIDEQGSAVLVRNAPADAAYLVVETVSGTRIVTTLAERYAYVGWDFVSDQASEFTFYNASLQPIDAP